MCADCHSTGWRRTSTSPPTRYATTWTDVNVACEACHGPGSRHVAWAQVGRRPARSDKTSIRAWSRWLKPTDGGHWEMNPATGIAHRTAPLASSELDTCAGMPFPPQGDRQDALARRAASSTAYLPALLEPGLYHADGQIDGEVFEYGSFLQSRMYRAGVTCSNCHEPHSLKLRAEGNALCAQCHLPAKFDVAAHHHHEPGSAGAQCVNCHMPTKTYMVVDARRDHSFRVPRPDLSVSIGTPERLHAVPCRPAAPHWAAAPVARMVSERAADRRRISARRCTPAAPAPPMPRRSSTSLILDPASPAIARGSALPAAARAMLTQRLQGGRDQRPRSPTPTRSSARRCRARSRPTLSPAMVQSVAPLLKRPRPRRPDRGGAGARGRRTAVACARPARRARRAPISNWSPPSRSTRDRPEAHLNLGLLNGRRGQPDLAEAEYRTALRLDPNFVPALANLADLERMRGRDQRGAELLRKAVEIEPDNADVRHALGLLLVRQRDYAEALAQLRQASELAPDNARYAYVYAVALNSSGAPERRSQRMEQAHARHPADRDILAALIGFARGQGDGEAALRYARELAAVDPANAQVRALIQELGRKTAP